MSRITYVNGLYLPHANARVHVEDRGYQFADGVYEVCEVRDGRLIDEQRHLDRLERSLSELAIRPPMSRTALSLVMREIVARNLVVNGMVYLQATRGVAPRDHAFPRVTVRASLVVGAHSIDPAKGDARARAGVRVVTMPDIRWKRPDIKSTALLPNVLARQAARDRNADEAWFVDADGFVTEGAASNAWIVTRDGVVVTRRADSAILRGVTRTTLIDLLTADGHRYEERPFTVAEAQGAREAFLTGATTIVMPIVAIDDVMIGDGRPGALASRLRTRFHHVAAGASAT